MEKTRVEFVEIIRDEELQKKEKATTEAIRRFYPDCGPVKLSRTSDGRIGVQMQVALAPGDRKRLEDAYDAVMKALGEKRGRPPGVKTVQTKLRLPKPVYTALKVTARAKRSTMSSVAAEALVARLHKVGRLP